VTSRRTIHGAAATVASQYEPAGEECPQMADLAYALVFIGIFLVLAFTLRGLERL
jgi:hypothetical protein